MLSQVVMVQREKLAACMTCPLCNKLFRDATTISECLHTFCRKCIYKKISDEEWDSCPICGIELGCAPLEKLRADHNLQDLRTKFFSSKSQMAKAPTVDSSISETVALAPLPARRKERSLSSLVVGAPKVLAKSVPTGRRSKSFTSKSPASQGSPPPVEEPVNKLDDLEDSLSSPETLNKLTKTKRQNSSTNESSKRCVRNKCDEDNNEPCEKNIDLWKPLKCLVEAASKTKSTDTDLQEIPVQMEPPESQESNSKVLKAKVMDPATKSKVNGDENSSIISQSGSIRPRRSRQKRPPVSEDLHIPAQALVGASSKCDRRFTPIWFSLVASDDQEGCPPLPQISSCYLRVKDGCLPVSSVKKYIAQKLGLASEAEVEISLSGRPVLPTMQLKNLVDWWLQMTPASEKIQTTVGSSAKDFMMVLSYGRKAQPQ
ncbi:hypothetical protein K2173_006478 [Erythroxylum novogranatense]|uniref:RING-type domain-containing protein n=1 Tax=Erythroxylum novogranatense TaxID=1862640 RepID=A0AAV8TCR9_9ROSI|nr:hypothetical protein K2173_006478 [Erythroxylum novogranatense]